MDTVVIPAIPEDDFSTFGRLGVIAMRGCEEIGERINEYITEFRFGEETDFLVKTSCPRFMTGEGKAIIEQTIRGYDIFIICDCYNYSVTYKMHDEKEHTMSPDDHYRDLIRTIAALGGKARRINVIMPMLYSSRQDNKYARESLDCAISLKELVNMGVSNILTFDAHEPRVQNAIPLSGFDTIRPSYQMVKALYDNVDDIELTRDKALIVSPDEGAMSKNEYYSSVLDLDIATFYKRRDYTRIVNGKNPLMSHDFLGKDTDVAGKDVIVIDDILASGDSILDVVGQVHEMGAKRTFVFITFGQFAAGTKKFDEAYENGVINKIFVTNTTYKPEEIKSKPWFCEVDISKYLAKLIDGLNCDHSISNLLNPVHRIRNLKELKEKNNK
ncbi:MAG: ribose-phosphate pyrophosphokinase [Oscillospiraceae bacterium]|nr:ribose-phosphate pyrophosphokinase [Oscillospiraceae bacterium]